MESKDTCDRKLRSADDEHRTAAGGDSCSGKKCRKNENYAENLLNIDMRNTSNQLNVSASNGDSDNYLGLRTPVRFRGDGILK